MNYQLIHINPITLYGIKTELSRSQSQNQQIISNHWKQFNSTLKSNKINLGVNWKKYGITLKLEQRYYYLIAIESTQAINGFESITLPKSEWVYFKHLGSMDLIKFTINTLYKKIIPDNAFKLNLNRQVVHFECYDQQFRWNHPDSVIHIYVPIETALT